MKTLEDMSAEAGRVVVCAKLGEELPALPFEPFNNDLGKRIYREISVKGWREWIEHSKLLVNEYRLDLTKPETHKRLLEQCEEFLFGDKADLTAPAEFVAPAAEGDQG